MHLFLLNQGYYLDSPLLFRISKAAMQTLCPPWLHLRYHQSCGRERKMKIHLLLLQSFPQQIPVLYFAFPVSTTLSSICGVTLHTRAHLSRLWCSGRTWSRAAPAPHCHHSSSISCALSTKRGPAWLSPREMPGSDWHIQGSWKAAPIRVGSDGAQPAALQGASQALRTS